MVIGDIGSGYRHLLNQQNLEGDCVLIFSTCYPLEIRAHRAIVLRRNDKGRRATLLSPRSSPNPLNRRCAGRDEFRADRIAPFQTVNRTIWGNVEFLSYPNGIPHNVQEQIEHELQLIRTGMRGVRPHGLRHRGRTSR